MVKRNPRIINRNKVEYQFPQKNLGGYFPHPPEDCVKMAKWVKHDEIIWIDLSICVTCPEVKKCPDRNHYLKMVKEHGIP